MERDDIDREIRENEQRMNRARDDDGGSIVDTAERAVNSVVKPITDQPLDEDDARQRRLLNDAEQRKGSELPG
jgi:hypothetical protein